MLFAIRVLLVEVINSMCLPSLIFFYFYASWWNAVDCYALATLCNKKHPLRYRRLKRGVNAVWLTCLLMPESKINECSVGFQTSSFSFFSLWRTIKQWFSVFYVFLFSLCCILLYGFKRHCYCTARSEFFSERVINIWNGLPLETVNFSTLPAFKRSINKVDLSKYCVVAEP